MDRFDAIMVIAVALLALICGVTMGYDFGHGDGYNHGITIQHISLEQTGDLVNDNMAEYYETHHWVDKNSNSIPDYWRP